MQKYFFGLAVFIIVLFVSGCTHLPTGEEQNVVENTDENLETDYLETPPPPFATIEDASILVGAWTVLEGGDYEEINLSADGTFSTFLYDKPFESGTWKLSNEGLTLDFDSLSDKVYANVDAEEGLLILESADYSQREVWEPIN